MKSFMIIFVLIVSSECGLLDDLDLVNESKAKSATESPNRTEYRQGVLIKVRETLKNGTKIVIDALGNVIRVPPKGNEDANSQGTPDSPKGTEEVKKDEVNKSDAKADLPTSTEKVEAPKVDENQNKTLPAEAATKDSASNVKEDVKNGTDTNKVDEDTGKNCTSPDDKACGSIKVANRTALKGDECPTGKSRADDGTCVDEI